MHRMAILVQPNGTEKEIDLHDIASNNELASLMNHGGVLTYLRQSNVTKLDPTDVYSPEPDSRPEPEPIPEPPISEPEPENKLGIIAILLRFLKNLFI